MRKTVDTDKYVHSKIVLLYMYIRIYYEAR